jgi:hypothetical protein
VFEYCQHIEVLWVVRTTRSNGRRIRSSDKNNNPLQEASVAVFRTLLPGGFASSHSSYALQDARNAKLQICF